MVSALLVLGATTASASDAVSSGAWAKQFLRTASRAPAERWSDQVAWDRVHAYSEAVATWIPTWVPRFQHPEMQVLTLQAAALSLRQCKGDWSVQEQPLLPLPESNYVTGLNSQQAFELDFLRLSLAQTRQLQVSCGAQSLQLAMEQNEATEDWRVVAWMP